LDARTRDMRAYKTFLRPYRPTRAYCFLFFFTALLLLNLTGCGGGSGTSTDPIAPTITTQPVDQTVTEGQAATFTGAATGTAPLNYQWQKNGTAISGATSSSYTMTATTAADSGSQFVMVVSNSVGTLSSRAAILHVNAGPPSITIQPASQTVKAGQTATFSVWAAGTPPLTYQWHKNGVSISGATSATYITPPTALGDSGCVFTVVASRSLVPVTDSVTELPVQAM